MQAKDEGTLGAGAEDRYLAGIAGDDALTSRRSEGGNVHILTPCAKSGAAGLFLSRTRFVYFS